MQHNPVCVVLDINLNPHRASEREACEVRVQEEMVVKRNNVPMKKFNMVAFSMSLKSSTFLFVCFVHETFKGTLGVEGGSKGRTY